MSETLRSYKPVEGDVDSRCEERTMAVIKMQIITPERVNDNCNDSNFWHMSIFDDA
jgi:hypothetical protein